METTAINHYWYQFIDRQKLRLDIAEEIYAILMENYTLPNRYYHNLDHVANCLTELYKVLPFVNDMNKLEYALLLHDVIYIAASKYNEQLSAAIAHSYALQLGLSDTFAAEVRQMILSTKQHPYQCTFDNDTKLMLDIDLAVLGSSPPIFTEYEKNIRKEYSFLSTSQYTVERVNFLSRLIDRDYIYYTQPFRFTYENTARINIKQLIDELNT